MSKTFRLDYKPGPNDKVRWAFFRSSAEVRGIQGPVGSGKTSDALMQFPLRAIQQAPSPIDNVRYTKWVSIRDTYRNLERTTIPSWLDWVPKEAGEWKGGANGEPGHHHLRFPMADGTIVDTVISFVAIGDAAIEDVLRGYEFTGAHLGEADRMSIDVVHYCVTRAGRYPPKRHGGPTWRGAWCDFNAPNWGDEISEYFIERDPLPPGIEYFCQPGGLDPDAENLENLPDGYYKNMIDKLPEHVGARMVHNKLGYSRDGKPVYGDDFSDTFHVYKGVIPLLDNSTLYVACDAGRSPAAIFLQEDSEGQIRAIDELVCEDMGAEQFGDELDQRIADRYPDCDIEGIADPASENPTETSNIDDDAWIDIVSNVTGIRFKPASSQKRSDREGGMRKALKTNIRADKPGFIVSSRRCPVLRRALNAEFRFAKKKIGGNLFHETPEKNAASHPGEACEYGVMEITGFARLRGREAKKRKRGQSRVQTHWRPGGF